MKVLNLYAGIGGNRKLWTDVEVTAVEINPDIAKIYSDFFPQENVIIGDAHQYLLEHFDEYDFIWSSPPCQSHSRMVKATRHNAVRYADLSLYQEIILLDHFSKSKWVVENVKPYYSPLIEPTGKFGRHYFWSNFLIPNLDVPKIKNFIQLGSVSETEELKNWLGLKYEGNIYYNNNHCPGQILRNCVHPKIGLHILKYAKNPIKRQMELVEVKQ